MRVDILTYVVLGLITAGAFLAAVDTKFFPLYNTFVTAILTAKGAYHVASMGNNLINTWGGNTNTNDAPLVENNTDIIVPSKPVPKQPIAPIDG